MSSQPGPQSGPTPLTFFEAQGGVRTVSSAINALAAQVNQAARALEQVVK
jgi:hypothetical protein